MENLSILIFLRALHLSNLAAKFIFPETQFIQSQI